MKEKIERLMFRVMFGGLAAFNSLLIAHLVGKESMDCYLNIAIYCLAFSLPFLVLGFLVQTIKEYATVNFNTDVICLFGILFCLIGITSVFCHFNLVAGGLFLVCASLAIGFYSRVHDGAQAKQQ